MHVQDRSIAAKTTARLVFSSTVALAIALTSGRAFAMQQQGVADGSDIVRLAVVASAAPIVDTTHAKPLAAKADAPAGVTVPRGPLVLTRNRTLPLVFFGVVGGGFAMSLAQPQATHDNGGYHDGWRTQHPFSDKMVHGLAAWALTSAGVDLHVSPKIAAATTCVAGAGFEYTHGVASRYDMAANCVGAAASAAWRTWRRKSEIQNMEKIAEARATAELARTARTGN